MFQNFYKFRGNNIFVDPRVKPCISTIYFDFGIHAQAVLTMQITRNLYEFYIIGILTSSKLLLLRATWKENGIRILYFQTLSNVGSVKNYKIVFVFFWKNMGLFVRRTFDILYCAVCHIFQCDIFCQREMRFCAFCHLLFWFSMIPLLCPHHLLFHYSKSLQAIFLYP